MHCIKSAALLRLARNVYKNINKQIKNPLNISFPWPVWSLLYQQLSMIQVKNLIWQYQRIWSLWSCMAKSHALEMTMRLTSFCPERISSKASSITPSLMSSNRSVTTRGGTRYKKIINKVMGLILKNVFDLSHLENNVEASNKWVIMLSTMKLTLWP